jgi:hypothetical protein
MVLGVPRELNMGVGNLPRIQKAEEWVTEHLSDFPYIDALLKG